jgi:hypothetical protein
MFNDPFNLYALDAIKPIKLDSERKRSQSESQLDNTKVADESGKAEELMTRYH